MASAPWVLLQPDQDVRTELNRWFLTVAGSVDAITAGVIAYPYWRDVRMFPSWWTGVSRSVLILAALAGTALLVSGTTPIARMAAKEGWKGRMIAPAIAGGTLSAAVKWQRGAPC